MPYRLREGLSYCEVDGCLVFLDLETDRYFRLPDRLGAALVAALRGDERPDADIDTLIAKTILVSSPASHLFSPARPIATPSRSAVEHRAKAPAIHALTVLEVATLVCSTQLQLKTRRLARILAALVARRQRLTAGAPAPTAPRVPDRLLDAAALFRQSRACVPIEPCCLLDSIAMVNFLARRRLPTTITFGVTLDPFAAHCWVQAGGWVLNDTVGNAVAHTPIRSV